MVSYLQLFKRRYAIYVFAADLPDNICVQYRALRSSYNLQSYLDAPNRNVAMANEQEAYQCPRVLDKVRG